MKISEFNNGFKLEDKVRIKKVTTDGGRRLDNHHAQGRVGQIIEIRDKHRFWHFDVQYGDVGDVVHVRREHIERV